MARVSTPVVLQFRVDDKGTVKIKSIDRSLKKNAREFDKNGKEVTKWAKTADRARKATALLATGLGVGLVGGFAAGGVALRKFSREFNELAKSVDETQKMARALGLTSEELSKFEFAAGLGGVAATDLQKAIRTAAGAALDAHYGLSTYTRTFDELGISVTDRNGELKSMEAILLDAADAFSKMEAGTRKTALASDLFGRSGAKMISMLNQGREGLAATFDEAEQLGIVISGDLTSATEQYNDNILRLTSGLRGVKLEIFSGLVDEAAVVTGNLSDALKENREEIHALVSDLTPSAQSLSDAFVVIAESALFMTDALNAAKNGIAVVTEMARAEARRMESIRLEQARSEVERLENELDGVSRNIFGRAHSADFVMQKMDRLKEAKAEVAELEKKAAEHATENVAALGRMLGIAKKNLEQQKRSQELREKARNLGAPREMSSRPSSSGGADIIDISGDIAARDGGGISLFAQLEGIKQRAVFDVLANQARGFANEIKASYLETQRLKQETQALQKATEEWRANRVTQGIDGAAVGPLAGGISAMSSTISGQRDYEKQLEELRSFHARERELLIQQGASIAEIQAANAQHVIEIDQAQNEQRVGLALGVTQSLGATLEGFRKQTSDDSVEGAILQRGLAIGEATIATYLAATKALAWGGPAGPGIAAAITALGLANVGLIAATPIQRYHTGGVVEPGPGGGPGETLAMLRVGETVRTQQQEAALGNRGGAQRAVVVYREDVEEVVRSVMFAEGLTA
jgi:hypothetical protein